MFAFLLLAATSACASSHACPSSKDLFEAVSAEDDALTLAISHAENAIDPGSIHPVHSERIRKVFDILCGDVLPGENTVVICRFTVRYWNKTVYKTAKVSRTADSWLISESLNIIQKAKN